jgi:peptidoglycan/LPS O-acetylase OafA/YrhL
LLVRGELSGLAPIRRWVERHRGSAHRDRASIAPTTHRRDIQGLRAIAVLLVVLDHAGVRFVQGGYVGVDVFFVLSGFLITGLLLAGVESGGHVSFTDFYIRRAKRILPAATLTLVTTMIASYFVLNYVRAKEVVWDSLWASLFVANIRFADQGTDYFAQGQPPSPIQHYWSLSVEEQFYFAWPALLAVALFGIGAFAVSSAPRRLHRRALPISLWGKGRLLLVLLVAGSASLAWSVHLTTSEPVAAYFSTLARAWELALGAALAIAAVYVERLPSFALAAAGWLGLVAIGIAAVTYSSATAFPGYAALLPTVGTVLVIAAGIGQAQSRAGPGSALSASPLRYVGDRSYAFYLWHWPVLVLAAQYVGHELSLLVNLLLIAGAFVLSVVSYALVENPIRRARWSRSASGTLIPASVGAVVLVSFFMLPSIDSRAPQIEAVAVAADKPAAKRQPSATELNQGRSLPAVVAAVKAARRGAKIPGGLTPPPGKLLEPEYLYTFPSGCVPVTASQTTSDVCRLGADNAAKSIVVFGDSHAQMWMPTILAMAKRDGWVVIPLVKSGCVPSSWLGNGYPGTKAAILRQCHAWYRWASRKAKSLRPDVVLMTGCCGGADGETARATRGAYISLTNSVKRVAKSVLVMADDEGVHRQPVDCLLARNASMKTCTSTWNDERFSLHDDLAAIAGKKGFGFLKTRGWFCFEYQCPMVVGRTVVYRDTGHITKPYALRLVSPFRAAFRRCILDACPR